MNQDGMKRRAAGAALEFVRSGMILGIGSGSTAAVFVEVLAASGVLPDTVIPASSATSAQLRAVGLPVVELAQAPAPSVYVDGADQADPQLRLLKGLGGAQTREKLLATLAPLFVCIVDESKLAGRLGDAPISLEVLPVARLAVEKELAKRGAKAVVRPTLSDDRNLLLDVFSLEIDDPEALELDLQGLPGVVSCGIFAHRRADVLLCGCRSGEVTVTRSSSSP